MRKIFRATAAAAFALLATASHAAQMVTQQQPCLTAEEANALFLSVAPSILHSVSETCAKSLPADAYLRVNGAALADQIDRIRRMPQSERSASGARGRAYVREHFWRPRQAAQVLEVFEGLVGTGAEGSKESQPKGRSPGEGVRAHTR